jgi:hypothetical protein
MGCLQAALPPANTPNPDFVKSVDLLAEVVDVFSARAYNTVTIE